eukprot:gene19003-22747_t
MTSSLTLGIILLVSAVVYISITNRSKDPSSDSDSSDNKAESSSSSPIKSPKQVSTAAAGAASNVSSPITPQRRTSMPGSPIQLEKSLPATPTKSPLRSPTTSATGADVPSTPPPVPTRMSVGASFTPPPVPPRAKDSPQRIPPPPPTRPSPSSSPAQQQQPASPVQQASSPVQPKQPLFTPVPPVTVNKPQPSSVEKIGKLLPQIPQAIGEQITKQVAAGKELYEKEKKTGKGMSTLRGIIGGVVKNIAPNSAAANNAASGISAEERDKNDQKRKQIAEEILQTEKAYVGKLKAIVDIYYIPLKTASTENPHPPLTVEQVHSIFSEILTIYNYNSHFLTTLEERMKSNNSSLVLGDLFISITDFLKSYSVYINNYSKGLATLEKVRKNSNIEALFQSFQENPLCGNLDLTSLLIQPVQRIPRYILLLDQMIKYTNKNSADLASLTKALDKMKVLASEMNENRREAELLNRMYEIHNNLDGLREEFIVPARKLIMEGDFTEKVIKALSSSAHTSTRRYILCTDMMLSCKQKGKKLIVKEHWNLNAITLKETSPGN